MKQKSGAQIIVKLLERQGIKIIAGIPGGSNLPLYDALEESSIRHILTRHEQGAGFLAQGMARSTGRAAVCFATSGPGATNLITAIADARLDSIPLVAISGQVPTALIGTDAFQEVDMFGLTLPITKHNFFVERAEDLLHVIPAAFRIAESGRPGPVSVDIPKDVQTAMVDFDTWPESGGREAPVPCDPETVSRAAAMIRQAKRPILYIGGGIVAAGAAAPLTALARRNSIPVASTLMGLGCFPPDDPLCLGMLGMHGARATNALLEEADLLLAFGVRFDDRAIGLAREFCSRASIIHVDIDESEINKIRASNLGITADINVFIQQLLTQIDSAPRDDWSARVQDVKGRYPLQLPDRAALDHPAAIIKRISDLLPDDAIITTDVGQHQMWTAQAYPVRQPRTLLTSGGLGTMGFGMPAAIGAALAHPDRKVVCISGDGSLLMNIQELATMAEQRVDVCVIIMNNNHLGLVRQQQELFYNKRYAASRFLSSPDFVAIARGFGIKAYDLADSPDPEATIRAALGSPGPVLVNAPVDHTANVFPMVPPGAPNREMIGGECHA